MDTSFTARPQFLGILYQIVRYPLYLALAHSENLDYSLYIERFDDIEIAEDSETIDSLQIKHVSTNLTNRSADLWKTLRVWSEKYKSGLVKLPGSILTLVTTALVPENSIAASLRGTNRDTEHAFDQIKGELSNTTPSLSKEFEAFGRLDSSEQKRLVDAIWVIDRAPTIDDLPSKIKEMCIGVLPTNLDDLYQGLEGWWVSQVVTHMRNGSKTPISVRSIREAVARINALLRERELVDPFLDYLLPEDYDWDKRTFVRQLRLIDFNPQLVLLAKRDYFRARSLRDYLVDELYLSELTSYDQRLIEQWELRFYATIEENCSNVSDEGYLQTLGKSVCNSVLKEVLVPIHQRLPDSTEYVTRGSYHILADDEKNLRIGWHPHFKQRLKSER